MSVFNRIPFKEFLGIDQCGASHHEKWISGLGGVVGIYLIFVTSGLFFKGIDHLLIVASMGASAVLLFAVPHGPLSQPWNVLLGHICSALIGVTVAQWVSDLWLAGALAVGGAITLMYYLRCVHPPGGASALVAVVGGQAVHDAGYWYVIQPVALNALVIVSVAVLFNYAFKWRRYPAAWAEKQEIRLVAGGGRYGPISHADLVYAISELDSFLDVTEDDLMRVYQLATGHNRVSATDGMKHGDTEA